MWKEQVKELQLGVNAIQLGERKNEKRHGEMFVSGGDVRLSPIAIV